MLKDFQSWIEKNIFEIGDFSKKESPTFRDLKKFIAQHSLGEIVPYRMYDEENEIYYNETTQGLVFEATPLIGATEQTIHLLTNLINHQLPEGASIQFLLYASPKVDSYLTAWAANRAERGERFVQLAQERVRFLAQGARGSLLKSGDFPIRTFRLIISLTLPNKQSVFEVTSLKETIKRSLKSLNVHVEALLPHQLIQLLGELFCPDVSSEPRKTSWRKRDQLNEQCVFHDVSSQITPNGVIVNEGESEIRLFSVSKFPEYWPQWAMQNLIGDLFLETQRIRTPFFLSLSVHIPNQAYESSKAAMKSMRAYRIANSPAAKYVPEASQIADERRYVIDLLNKNNRLVKLTFQIGLISEPSSITKDESVLESLFISQGWQLYRHRYTHLPLLFSCFPMVQDKELFQTFQRFGVVHTQPAHVVANVAPLQGEFKGMEVPRLMLTGRRGQLMWFDPFSNDAGNYNVCVTGKSGSGKSVFMQELATSIVGSGGNVWVVDVGHSYENICKLLGGEFIDFGMDKQICINPFSNIKELDEDQVVLLKIIIEKMAAPNDPITDIDRVLIEEAIQATWQQYRQENNITHIAHYLCENSDLRAQDLGRRLYPYTEKGIYGRYFNGKATITYDNPFLVMELQELKTKGDMLSIVLLLIFFQITILMYKGKRNINFAFIIDEAWKVLAGDEDKIKKIGEEMGRCARKYQFSLITGTQSLQDYFDNPAAEAIYNNSDYTIILMQKAGVIEKLKSDQKISLDPHMEKLIQSLRMSEGEYAEMLIRAPNWYSVAQLILDDFTLALYSTKGKQFQAVQDWQKQGKSLVEAVRMVAKESFHDR